MIISVFVIILLRLIWILVVPTIPFSDFEVYHNFGIFISKQFPIHLLSIDYDARGFGYSFVLGIIYKIFGVSLFAAKLLNVFLSALTGILLYLIAGSLFDECTARITTVLYSIWPAQIMYNSVLASEHLFIFFIFLGIAMFIGAIKVKPDDAFTHIFLAGVIFGLAYTVRFLSIIIVATGFMTLLFFQEHPLKNRIRSSLLLISGFAIVWILFTGLGAAVDIPSDPRTGIQNSLLMGTNYEYTGSWNLVDSQIWENNSPEEAKKIAFQTGLSRIAENPGGFLKLIFEKFSVIWGNESFGAYWSTVNLDSTKSTDSILQNLSLILAVPQFYYFGILFFSLLGCYKLKNTNLNIGIRFLFIIFLIFVILHSFLEVQSRYHYPWELIFIILGGYGIACKPVIPCDP
ncbi:glycosyltransferase family 39 protein [Methanosarcina sp. 2.H.A.1B.4]|uniref:glycosyltransferase family 39 protein n=1 Tax=Methanosarcina sp. 2.H.A.1B.4 TaxID=1483600 RepID=UPI001F242C3E|nr:glycosyltransferase family 39 protein [Methanosarcina sp. 2.H.A.1B.4]